METFLSDNNDPPIKAKSKRGNRTLIKTITVEDIKSAGFFSLGKGFEARMSPFKDSPFMIPMTYCKIQGANTDDVGCDSLTFVTIPVEKNPSYCRPTVCNDLSHFQPKHENPKKKESIIHVGAMLEERRLANVPPIDDDEEIEENEAIYMKLSVSDIDNIVKALGFTDQSNNAMIRVSIDSVLSVLLNGSSNLDADTNQRITTEFKSLQDSWGMTSPWLNPGVVPDLVMSSSPQPTEECKVNGVQRQIVEISEPEIESVVQFLDPYDFGIEFDHLQQVVSKIISSSLQLDEFHNEQTLQTIMYKSVQTKIRSAYPHLKSGLKDYFMYLTGKTESTIEATELKLSLTERCGVPESDADAVIASIGVDKQGCINYRSVDKFVHKVIFSNRKAAGKHQLKKNTMILSKYNDDIRLLKDRSKAMKSTDVASELDMQVDALQLPTADEILAIVRLLLDLSTNNKISLFDLDEAFRLSHRMDISETEAKKSSDVLDRLVGLIDKSPSFKGRASRWLGHVVRQQKKSSIDPSHSSLLVGQLQDAMESLRLSVDNLSSDSSMDTLDLFNFQMPQHSDSATEFQPQNNNTVDITLEFDLEDARMLMDCVGDQSQVSCLRLANVLQRHKAKTVANDDTDSSKQLAIRFTNMARSGIRKLDSLMKLKNMCLSAMFDVWDQDKRGWITADDVSNELTKLNLLSSQILGLEKRRDELKRVMDLQEQFRQEEVNERDTLVENAEKCGAASCIRKLYETLQAKGRKLADIFIEFDKNGTGMISQDDLRQGLLVIALPSDRVRTSIRVQGEKKHKRESTKFSTLSNKNTYLEIASSCISLGLSHIVSSVDLEVKRRGVTSLSELMNIRCSSIGLQVVDNATDSVTQTSEYSFCSSSVEDRPKYADDRLVVVSIEKLAQFLSHLHTDCDGEKMERLYGVLSRMSKCHGLTDDEPTLATIQSLLHEWRRIKWDKSAHVLARMPSSLNTIFPRIVDVFTSLDLFKFSLHCSDVRNGLGRLSGDLACFNMFGSGMIPFFTFHERKVCQRGLGLVLNFLLGSMESLDFMEDGTRSLVQVANRILSKFNSEKRIEWGTAVTDILTAVTESTAPENLVRTWLANMMHRETQSASPVRFSRSQQASFNGVTESDIGNISLQDWQKISDFLDPDCKGINFEKLRKGFQAIRKIKEEHLDKRDTACFVRVSAIVYGAVNQRFETYVHNLVGGKRSFILRKHLHNELRTLGAEVGDVNHLLGLVQTVPFERIRPSDVDKLARKVNLALREEFLQANINKAIASVGGNLQAESSSTEKVDRIYCTAGDIQHALNLLEGMSTPKRSYIMFSELKTLEFIGILNQKGNSCLPIFLLYGIAKISSNFEGRIRRTLAQWHLDEKLTRIEGVGDDLVLPAECMKEFLKSMLEALLNDIASSILALASDRLCCPDISIEHEAISAYAHEVIQLVDDNRLSPRISINQVIESANIAVKAIETLGGRTEDMGYIDRVCTVFKTKNVRIIEFFTSMDPYKTGYITSCNLSAKLTEWIASFQACVDHRQKQTDKLSDLQHQYSRMTNERTELLELREYADKCGVTKVMDVLHRLMDQRGMKLRDLFEDMDVSGDGILQISEIKDGLLKAVGPSAEVVCSHEIRRKKKLVLMEKEACRQSNIEKRRQRMCRTEAVTSILVAIDKYIRKRKTRLVNVFHNLCGKTMSVIHEDQLNRLVIEALSDSGQHAQISEEDMTCLMRLLDESGDGLIDISEFETILREWRQFKWDVKFSSKINPLDARYLLNREELELLMQLFTNGFSKQVVEVKTMLVALVSASDRLRAEYFTSC